MTGDDLPFCRECGYELGDARFCPQCGAPRGTATSQAPVPSEPGISEAPPRVPDVAPGTSVPTEPSGSRAYAPPPVHQPRSKSFWAVETTGDKLRILGIAVGVLVLLMLLSGAFG